MPFSNIFDAQTQAVNAVISRKALETTYVTYNDDNDPTKSLRLAVKVSIKNEQAIIDAANSYLVALRTPALIYKSLLVNNAGFVATPWSNEKDVPNTFQYNLTSTATPTDTELQEAKDNLTDNISAVAANLAADKERLKEIKAFPDSSPVKTVLLKSTQDSIDVSNQVIKELVDSKKDVEEVINSSITKIVAPHPLVDTFSEGIRKDIHDRLVQKVGYNASLNDDEATIIMRKKALDAFYTAKSSSEKAAALERLNRTAAAMDVSIPITRSVYQFDPDAFANLHQAINIVDAEVLDLSNQLADAKASENTIAIAQAQALYNQKYLEKINLVDTLLGFRDTNITSVSYPGSHNIVTQSGPTIATDSTAETDEVNQALQQQNSGNLSGDTIYFDQKTQKFVKAKEVELSESGRYILARDATNEDVESYQYQISVDGYQQDYDNRVAGLDANSLTAYNAMDYQRIQANIEIANNNDQISILQKSNDPNKDAKIATLTQQNSILEATKADASNTYNAIHTQNEETKTREAVLLNQEIQDRTIQRDQVLDATQVVPTINEARAVTSNYETAKADSNLAEVSFNKSYEIAVQHARENGATDPKDPANWSVADTNAVSAKQALLQGARQDEAAAATKFNVYATETPGGRNTLLQSGLTDTEINAVNEKALQSRNKNDGLDDRTKAGFGNTATSIDGSNVRPSNGFEGINNGAPFYFQFPTLKAITDFRMRNGISPYGRQSQDEIARNAIHFNIFEVTPPSAKAKLVDGTSGLIRNEVEPAQSNTIGSFTIYPSNQELSMNHSHSYNDDLGLASIVQKGLDVVNGLDTLLTFGAAALDSAANGKEQSIPQRLQRRIESIDKYQGTEKQVMTTEFNLFTKNDFLHDVFRPLMFLTALSYPKRNLTGNIGDDILKTSNVLNAAAEKNSTVKTILDNVKKFSPDITPTQLRDIVNNLDKTFAETGGAGPFRYFITKSPEYISVRHASGLFYLPLAVILGLDYTFEGPWYNYAGDVIKQTGNLDEVVRVGINTSTSGRSFKEIFADIKQPFTTNPFAKEGNTRSGPPGSLSHLAGLGPNDPLLAKYKLPFAYPTSARCTIRYKSAVSQFRDDYLRLFYEAGKPNGAGGAGIVSISEEQTATLNSNVTNIEGQERAKNVT